MDRTLLNKSYELPVSGKGRTRKRFSVFIIIVAILLFSLLCLDRYLAKLVMKQRLPDGWHVIQPPYGVLSIEIQGDIVWAGGKEGVCAIDRRTYSIVRKIDGSHHLSYVKDLEIDKQGRLWIADFNGLSVYYEGRLKTYTVDDGLPDNRVNALCVDNSGSLWVGTWGGAVILADVENSTEGEIRFIDAAPGLIDSMVNVIMQDSSGGMWFGSYVAPRGGISYLRNGTWSYFTTSSGLPHNNITCFIEESPEKIWVGTGLFNRGGAVLFIPDAGGWKIGKTLTKDDGLAGERVRSIFKDRDGSLWFGSEYDGIARYRNGMYTVFSTKDGLPHNEVTSVLQDGDGNIWFGTLGGVLVIEAGALPSLR